MRIRLPILLPIAVPVFLILGYSVYWFTAAEAVRTGIDEWILAQRAQGVAVRHGDIDVGGFPLLLDARVDDVVMTDAAGIVWNTAGISAKAPPWRLTRIEFQIEGPQRVTVPGLQPLTVSAGSGVGEIGMLGSGRLATGSLALPDLTVLMPAIGALKVATLELAIAEQASGPRNIDLVVGGDARQVDLPVSPLPALGAQIDHIGLDLRVSAPLPDQLRAAQMVLWREAGGTARIDRLELGWGPLSIAASGTLTLDAELQPQGTLTANIRGFLQTVDALVDAGLVEAEQAGLVKAGLALLAGAPDADGVPTLTAPLSIRDRRVLLGPLQVATLPPVVWR